MIPEILHLSSQLLTGGKCNPNHAWPSCAYLRPRPSPAACSEIKTIAESAVSCVTQHRGGWDIPGQEELV